MAAVLDHVRAPAAVRFTRQDCERMRQLGLLPAQYELVNGEVIAQMGQNMPHADIVMEIASWLIANFGTQFVVSQATTDVAPEDNPTSEPAPDVILLNKSKRQIAWRPNPADIRLLVEVADTTLTYDLHEKGPLYARAGIPEYWVVDVNKRQVHRHANPSAGRYERVDVLMEHQSIAAPGGAVTTIRRFFEFD